LKDSDTREEREMKLKVIQIYNKRLDERERRQDFVVSRGLLDYKKIQSNDRKRTREEREIVQKMRSFATYHSAADHDQLVTNMIEEMRIRKKLEQLMKYRQLGIRTPIEAERYEVEKKKREVAELQRKQKENAAYLYNSGRQNTSTSRRGSVRGTDLSQGVDAFDIERMQGSSLLSLDETNLCKTLRIMPQQYLILKNTLLRESTRMGFLTKAMAQSIVKDIDSQKVAKLHAHFVKVRWVNIKPINPEA